MKLTLVVLFALVLTVAGLASPDDTAVTGQDQTVAFTPPQPVKNADREIDEFGPLHDPELILQFQEGPQNHTMGIAWDGTYYWTINGGNQSGLLNRYDEDGVYVATTNVAIDGRGIVFNPVDGLLYISSYMGNIYRIDDPMTGATTMVGSGVMQDSQASFGMSWDGNLLYDHMNGTVRVHDFWNFNILDTMTGFNYGAGNFGGNCSIIADTDYLYTINATIDELYVYELDGTYVGSYTLPNGGNGMSLSMANYMIWYCDDSIYSIGTWYGYNLRDWTEGPVQFHLYPTTTLIPPGGGDVVYDVQLISQLPGSYPGCQYRTYVTLPNSQQFGPLMTVNFTLAPFMNVYQTNLTQNIPLVAPPGIYTFTGVILYNGIPRLDDDFHFTKQGPGADGGFIFDPEDWQAGGSLFGVAGDGESVQRPLQFELSAPYPNPFNPSTSLSVTLPQAARLTVRVFNTAGQVVATLADGHFSAGTQAFTLNGSSLASGLYFVQASVPGELNQIRKLTLLK